MNAAALYVALEARGFTLQADGEGLIVRPSSSLTDEGRADIRAVKDELVRLAREPRGWLARRDLEFARSMARVFAPDGTRLCEDCGAAAIADGRGLCGACTARRETSAA